MSRRWERWAGALLFAAGCGDSSNSSDAPIAGAETAPCVDGLCFGELKCLSNVCVDPGGGSSPTSSPGSGDPTGQSSTSDTGTSDPGTGDPTNASASASAPTTSTSGPPPPQCGDGQLDDGEECDDGNAVDDDACTNACIVNQYAVKFVDTMKLPAIGQPTGGDSFNETCMGAFIGAKGFTTDDYMGVGKIWGICLPMFYVPDGQGYVLDWGKNYDTEPHGYGVGGSSELIFCGGGVVTGLSAWTDDIGMTSFQIHCADVSIGGGEVVVGASGLNNDAFGWMGFGQPTVSMCPAGYIAIGFHGTHENFRMHSMGITCAKPTL